MELTSLSGFAFQPDPAAMLLNQEPGDGKTESGAFTDVLGGVQASVECFEDGLVFFVRYADPCIDHRDVNSCINGCCNQTNTSSRRSEFDRVAEQIIKNLLHSEPDRHGV